MNKFCSICYFEKIKFENLFNLDKKFTVQTKILLYIFNSFFKIKNLAFFSNIS